jgi:branched-chain amino acid transport system permease protein
MPERITRFALPRGVPATIAVVALLFGLVVFGSSAGDYYADVAIMTFLAVILALGVRLLLLAGEASLAHGVFYAMGAYTVAILTARHGVNFWAAMALGGFVAAAGALIIGIPSLRTSGAYFFTMTFGALVVGMSVAQYWTSLTGGFAGISGIHRPPGFETVPEWFALTLVLVVVCVAIFYLFERSRWGLELRAIGDSRDLAQAVGVNPLRTMLAAFVVGAFFAGIAGGFYASYVTFVAPTSFTYWLSTYILMYVILGGTRYFVGAIVGTLVLAVLPTMESWSAGYVGMFVPGITLLIFMLAPRGIVTSGVDFARKFGARRRPALRLADAPREGGQAPAHRPVKDGDLMLQVSGVGKRFGGLQALDGVELEVRKGEIVGIIGPNGAGKTTLFNVISGFTRPTTGKVVLHGEAVDGASPSHIVENGLTRTFQASAVFERLTVLENVVVACRRRRQNPLSRAFVPIRMDKAALARARGILEDFGLDEYGDTEAGSLPYGARKRLGVAIAMATNPQLVCLDEPMAGLSDREVEQMSELLEDLKERHDITVVLIEHRIPAIMRLCDRVVALDFGRVIASGSPQDVARDPSVVEAYLGGELTEVGRG